VVVARSIVLFVLAVGAAICLVAVAVIMYGPRAT
jgi:drug/metabolite transporter superfamily protein YnfA